MLINSRLFCIRFIETRAHLSRSFMTGHVQDLYIFCVRSHLIEMHMSHCAFRHLFKSRSHNTKADIDKKPGRFERLRRNRVKPGLAQRTIDNRHIRAFVAAIYPIIVVSPPRQFMVFDVDSTFALQFVCYKVSGRVAGVKCFFSREIFRLYQCPTLLRPFRASQCLINIGFSTYANSSFFQL